MTNTLKKFCHTKAFHQFFTNFFLSNNLPTDSCCSQYVMGQRSTCGGSGHSTLDYCYLLSIKMWLNGPGLKRIQFYLKLLNERESATPFLFWSTRINSVSSLFPLKKSNKIEFIWSKAGTTPIIANRACMRACLCTHARVCEIVSDFI